MWISDTSIKRPVFATMVIMSFMVLGVVSMTRLGIDLFPEVNFPFVNVMVVYPGAGPEEVETLVTRPIEDAVLIAMRDTMVHRGPDGGDLWISTDRQVGLGHRRPGLAQCVHVGGRELTRPLAEDQQVGQ